jgi:hypothetical protein
VSVINSRQEAKMKKYYFVYKTTNLINGKFYIGVHATKNINDGYLGSGTRLGDAIKHYGKENFNREIIEFFDCYEDALALESKLVTEVVLQDPLCYNLVLGGGKPPNHSGDMHWLSEKSERAANFAKASSKRMLEKNPSKGNFGVLSKTYGMVSVVDSNGNTMQVRKDDTRYVSGELVHVNKGKVTVRDKDGRIFHVSKDDPRFISGEVVHNTAGIKYVCPHCSKEVGAKRWHFNNCKYFRKEGL